MLVSVMQWPVSAWRKKVRYRQCRSLHRWNAELQSDRIHKTVAELNLNCEASVFMSVKQSTIQRFVLYCIQPVRYKMIKDHRVSGGLFYVLDRIWGRGKISCMKWIMRLQ